MVLTMSFRTSYFYNFTFKDTIIQIKSQNLKLLSDLHKTFSRLLTRLIIFMLNLELYEQL